MSDDRFPALKREPVFEHELPAVNPPVKLVKAARIRFAPAQPTGLHLHPMSTVGVVTKGSFIFQLDGEAARQLFPGDGFFEPAGRTVLEFDNASGSEDAEILCFYLTDTGNRPAIEMLEDGDTAGVIHIP